MQTLSSTSETGRETAETNSSFSPNQNKKASSHPQTLCNPPHPRPLLLLLLSTHTPSSLFVSGHHTLKQNARTFSSTGKKRKKKCGSVPLSRLHLSVSVSRLRVCFSQTPPPFPSTLPGSRQGFLAAVLAFPLGPVLIWVISTSVRASGGRPKRMRSMVLWYAALSCSRERSMCFSLLSRERKVSTLVSSDWIFCRAAWRMQK